MTLKLTIIYCARLCLQSLKVVGIEWAGKKGNLEGVIF